MINTCCKCDKGPHLFKIFVEIAVLSTHKAIFISHHVLS